MKPPIHIIANKHIPALGQLASLPKQLQQIIELAMDVPADSNGGTHRLAVRFLHQDVFHRVAKQTQSLLT